MQSHKDTVSGSSYSQNLHLQGFALTCLVTSRGFPLTKGPPTPLRSFPDLVSLTQSMREKPGARATLFLGFPVAEPTTCCEVARGNNPPFLSGLLIPILDLTGAGTDRRELEPLTALAL